MFEIEVRTGGGSAIHGFFDTLAVFWVNLPVQQIERRLDRRVASDDPEGFFRPVQFAGGRVPSETSGMADPLRFRQVRFASLHSPGDLFASLFYAPLGVDQHDDQYDRAKEDAETQVGGRLQVEVVQGRNEEIVKGEGREPNGKNAGTFAAIESARRHSQKQAGNRSIQRYRGGYSHTAGEGGKSVASKYGHDSHSLPVPRVGSAASVFDGARSHFDSHPKEYSDACGQRQRADSTRPHSVSGSACRLLELRASGAPEPLVSQMLDSQDGSLCDVS